MLYIGWESSVAQDLWILSSDGTKSLNHAAPRPRPLSLPPCRGKMHPRRLVLSAVPR